MQLHNDRKPDAIINEIPEKVEKVKLDGNPKISFSEVSSAGKFSVEISLYLLISLLVGWAQIQLQTTCKPGFNSHYEIAC